MLGKSLVTYYWALQYLSRCDLFPAASAEGSMLKQRIVRVYSRLLEEKVPKEALVDIGAVTDPAAYAKEKIDGAVDWVCGLPVLKEVSDWSAAASG